MKLKTIIADQENKYSSVIQDYLKEHKSIEIINVFNDFDEGVNYLVTNPWDLMILYISRPTNDCKGSELNKIIAPQTILIADNPEFAVESYELDGPDYILTPFTKERLLQSVDKYHKYYSKRDSGEFERLLNDHSISLKTGKSMVNVKINEMLYLEGFGEYIKIHLVNSNFLTVYGTFDSILNLLPKELFMRCHRSYCINRRHLDAIFSDKCILKGKIAIPISAKYKGLIKFI